MTRIGKARKRSRNYHKTTLRHSRRRWNLKNLRKRNQRGTMETMMSNTRTMMDKSMIMNLVYLVTHQDRWMMMKRYKRTKLQKPCWRCELDIKHT
jgi:hypothetical protein